MAAVKFRFIDQRGPFRRFVATFQRVGGLPRGPQFSARDMMTLTKGRRGFIPRGTDKNAPRVRG